MGKGEIKSIEQMKTIFLFCCISVFSLASTAQTNTNTNTRGRKGSLYLYWGWNWDNYSKSDISFSGPDYHFTLQEVVARDSPSNFTVEKYFGIQHFSIPQFNFRIGYCLSDHWDISFGMDHMKYVVEQNQVVQIDGTISKTDSPYNGEYVADDILIVPDFLQFEHTDGLNYENLEARYSNMFFDLNKITFNYTAGIGAGMLLPKTNTTLLNMERHDDYHLSGYGISGVIGLNALFFKHFFIQAEMKAGVINMPDIRTTFDSADRAHQQFMFYQHNIVFGALFHIGHKPKQETGIE
jgi:hypothetical protein